MASVRAKGKTVRQPNGIVGAFQLANGRDGARGYRAVGTFGAERR
jgi:hypothetical protein